MTVLCLLTAFCAVAGEVSDSNAKGGAVTASTFALDRCFFTCELTTANTGLPNGSRVAIHAIDLATSKAKSEMPSRLRVWTNETAFVKSASLTYFENGLAVTGGTRNLLRYQFATTTNNRLILEVGKSYPLTLTSESGEAVAAVSLSMISTRAPSIVVDSLYADKAYTVISGYTGEVEPFPTLAEACDLKWENYGAQGVISYDLPISTWTLGDREVTLNGAPLVMTNEGEVAAQVEVTGIVDIPQKASGCLASLTAQASSQGTIDLVVQDGQFRQVYNGGTGDYGSCAAVSGIHVVTLKYDSTKGTSTFIDGEKVMSASGLRVSQAVVSGSISLGARADASRSLALKGLVVKSVRVDYSGAEKTGLSMAETIVGDTYAFGFKGERVTAIASAGLSLKEKLLLIGGAARQGEVVQLPIFTKKGEEVCDWAEAALLFRLTANTQGGEVQPRLHTFEQTEAGLRISAKAPMAFQGELARPYLVVLGGDGETVRSKMMPSAITTDAEGNTLYLYDIDPAEVVGEERLALFRFCVELGD